MPSSKFMPSYGVLNRIEKPFSSPRVDTENFDSISSIKGMIKDFYTSDSLSNTGPYKGIVLRIEGKTESQAGNWLSKYFSSMLGEGKEPKLLKIKVRIPELHSMLPIPKSFDGIDNAIIDMYPTYVAQSTDLPEPLPGSLVWVDYVNKTNLTDPIYIKPVSKNQTVPGGSGNTSAIESHNSICPSNLSSNSPKGDEISGKNKALSHAGLPLLPRKPVSSMVGENILVPVAKERRFNQLIVSSWEKEIKVNGIPGKSWIGCLDSNGADDKTHSLGKRQTIIFSPNVADFTSPIELIYYFHGFNEFDIENDFRKRYPQNIKKMASDGRNFVLVIPELPWSKMSSKSKENSMNGNVWKGFDNFANFHRDIGAILKESFSSYLNIGYISIIGGNSSLKSINAAFDNGLDSVKPNRLVLTEFDSSVFSNFLKKGVEINLVVKKDSEDEKRYNSFQSENKNKILFKSLNDDIRTIWNTIIPYYSDEEKKKSLPNQSESKLPAPKNADVAPSSKSKVTINGKDQTNSVIIKDAVPFEPARVSVADYGSLQGTEDILTAVPSVGQTQFLHVLVAKRFFAMSDSWNSDNPNDPPILISSGWREHRWTSEADYEVFVKQKYGSVEEGRKYIAYNSPHETGLAFDIGNNGLTTDSLNIEQQKKTKLYKWMVNNAYKFGITPYSIEPWHWECRLPRESWASGNEFTDNLAVRVENPGKGNNMPMPGTLNKNCVNVVGNFSIGGKSIVNGEIDKSLKDAKELKLLWSDYPIQPKPNISQLVEWGKIIDQQLGDIIKKYQGSVPYGLICIRIGHETQPKSIKDDKSKLVTKCCGETGYTQVWHGKEFAKTKDIKDSTSLGKICSQKIQNYDPFNIEHNILCGLANWNQRGLNISKQFAKYFPEPDAQFWAMVNIEMNIGNIYLLQKANVTPGNALNDLCRWVVDQGSGLENYKKLFGTQSAKSIARRILVTPYWIEAARQLTGKDLYSSNYGLTFKQMIG